MRRPADRALARLTAELSEISSDDLGLILDAFPGTERKRLESLLAAQGQLLNPPPPPAKPSALLPGLSPWLTERLTDEAEWRLDGRAPQMTAMARKTLAACASPEPTTDRKRFLAT